MSDLEDFLSTEEILQFHRLPAQLRLWKVTTNDIITLSPAEIAKKTNVSATAIVRLRGCIVKALAGKELEEYDEIDARYHENEHLYEEHKRLCPGKYLKNDQPYEEYLRLASNEYRKRKPDEFVEVRLPEEEFEDLSDDEHGVPYSTKRQKMSNEEAEAFEKAREAYLFPPEFGRRSFIETGRELEQKWRTIGLLEGQLTKSLAGGIAPGYITEVSGESGCGKTQLMMHLLLAVQLPAPVGLSKAALYLSTESSLPTGRVRQLLAEHPILSEYPPHVHPDTGTGTWPSLDNIYTQEINTLDVQERVMENLVPLLIERKNIGLVVIDSLTGNYREEFSNPELGFRENMTRRARTMRKMGALLREYAKAGVAVVVVNQVSDRFRRDEQEMSSIPRSSALASTTSVQDVSAEVLEADRTRTAMANRLRGWTPPSHAPGEKVPDEERELNIALQEQYFSGWGDDPFDKENLKNPWGGISWTKQLSCRIALIKQLDRVANDGSFRRWAKVVFSAWSPNSGLGVRHRAVEYKITPGGIQSYEADYPEPRTPPANPLDPYGMEDPAVEEAFLELERNWAHQHRDILDQDKGDSLPLQIQTMKMQEPILMTQIPIEVHATHITFDESGQHVANQELTAPRLSSTSGIGNWNRRTGTASSPVVTPRRLFTDEVADTQAENDETSDFEDAPNHARALQQKVPSGYGGPNAHSESPDSEHKNDPTNAKKGDDGQPATRRFGSEVPDSEAESEDESDAESFVEKNIPERQWETDHHVEEAAHIQIPDDMESDDNFLHPHTAQEVDAHQADKEQQNEEHTRESPSAAPKAVSGVSAMPVAAVKAVFSRDHSDKSKFPVPQPLFTADKESSNPRATMISGWVSQDGQKIVESSTGAHAVNPPDDAFVPSRPYGEAIRTLEERAGTMDEMTSMPASTQPNESASKKERRAAKRARKEAQKALKGKEKDPFHEWSLTPEAKRFKELEEKYPFNPSVLAHAAAMADLTNIGSKAQLQGAYELMCVQRARAHGLEILDWPVGRTPEGDYIDIETGFHLPKVDAEILMRHKTPPESRIGTYYSTNRRRQGGGLEVDDNGEDDVDEPLDPNTPSRPKSGKPYKTPTHRVREGSIPHSQLSPKSDRPNVHYPSAQPRESMQPESPRRKETPIPPPKTWSQNQLERKNLPPILPGAKPASKPPSTPVRPRAEQSPQSSSRSEAPILPSSKPASPAPVEAPAPVRVVTPIRPPSSPLPNIPDVPSMKRMKKRLPGSQLRNVMNSSDAIEPPQLDDGERQKSKSMEPPPALDQENIQRNSAPRSSPPLSMPPPATQASKVQALSPSKARSRYSPTQRKRSQLQETYNHSSDPDNAPQPAVHQRSDYEDISQEDPPPAVEERPRDPPILPGMKPTKPLPVYKHPKHSHKKKPPVTPATPLRPDQMLKDDDIDYDALFPSQGESQESPVKKKQVFITKQGVQYPASKPGKDFYGTPKIVKEVVYPPTKGQRDAEEAERLEKERPSTQKKKVVFNYPPTKALDTENMDPEDEGEAMANILNFAALGTPANRKQQSAGGFLPLTSSPPKPWMQSATRSAPAKTFHATSISNATINALTVSRQPRYNSKPSEKWKEVQKELGIEVLVPSSQPEADEQDDSPAPGNMPETGAIASKTTTRDFETTASDDEYGFDAEMLEAMNEVVVPSAPSTTQKRARQPSPQNEKQSTHELDPEPSNFKRVRRETSASALASESASCAASTAPSPHHAGAQRRTSTDSNISVPESSRERTSRLFDRVKTYKAQGLGMGFPPPPLPLPPSREEYGKEYVSKEYVPGYMDGSGVYRPPESQYGGPSRAWREMRAGQRRSSGTMTMTRDGDGGRTWIPDEQERETPVPSIEMDEEDIAWENKALKQQAEREMGERVEREERRERDRMVGKVDPKWLYENMG